jgi:hypothetical protein
MTLFYTKHVSWPDVAIHTAESGHTESTQPLTLKRGMV